VVGSAQEQKNCYSTFKEDLLGRRWKGILKFKKTQKGQEVLKALHVRVGVKGGEKPCGVIDGKDILVNKKKKGNE